MNNLKSILRWVAVLPVSILVAFLITFPLHWIIYFLFSQEGDTDLGSVKFFIHLFARGVTAETVEYMIYPSVIAATFIITGYKIAPRHKFKTAIVLFGLYAISWLGGNFYATSINDTEIIRSTPFSARSFLTLFGAIIGLIWARLEGKKEEEFQNYSEKKYSTETKLNAKINFGKSVNKKDILIDLKKEGLHTILLIGSTGSGKSIFDRYFYKQLMENNSPEDMGFVFFDMTRVDFTFWSTPYLFSPVVDWDESITAFEKLGQESRARAEGKVDTKRAIFIHIEECDMMANFPERFEKAWLDIANNKDKNNMYVVFSTSRPAPDVFTKVILDNTDLKIVFILASEHDSIHVLGKSLAEKFTDPGQKVLVYDNKEVLSLPLTKEQVNEVQEFDEKMTR